MNEQQKAAAQAALEAWAGPQIAAASWMERGAIQAYLEQHKDQMIEVIGNAVLSVPSDPAS
jgi:hypothetical protein